jgi:hypothetical protein
VARRKHKLQGDGIVLGYCNLYESRWLWIGGFLSLLVTTAKPPSPTVKGSFGQSFSFAELTNRHVTIFPGLDYHLPKLPPFSLVNSQMSGEKFV